MTEIDREIARRLRSLHALIRVGECNSAAADAIRDEMDDDYYRGMMIYAIAKFHPIRPAA